MSELKQKSFTEPPPDRMVCATVCPGLVPPHHISLTEGGGSGSRGSSPLTALQQSPCLAGRPRACGWNRESSRLRRALLCRRRCVIPSLFCVGNQLTVPSREKMVANCKDKKRYVPSIYKIIAYIVSYCDCIVSVMW